MTYEDLLNYSEETIDSFLFIDTIRDVFNNIVLYGILKEERLSEFNFSIKHMDPYMNLTKFHELLKKDTSYFVRKIDEVARYYKVNQNDILSKNEDFKIDCLLVHKFYDDTLNKKIEWKRRPGDRFESKDIHFSERTTESVMLYPGAIIYNASSKHSKTIVRNQAYVDGKRIFPSDAMMEELSRLYECVNKTIASLD